MENKFTPGPWEVIRYNDLQYSIYNQGEGYVEKDISDEEDIANEKLIAAAPELYEALAELTIKYNEIVSKQNKGFTFNDHLLNKAKSALKKATE